ncbi:MAG: hypothetical protein NTV06_01655 [candidate division Zixibacteria bacterium]|nr:hypothetical protein [candidate division Zixibacteria bacterium]
MNPTTVIELNEEAIMTVQSAHFDTYWIPPDMREAWFVYKYRIQLPERLK